MNSSASKEQPDTRIQLALNALAFLVDNIDGLMDQSHNEALKLLIDKLQSSLKISYQFEHDQTARNHPEAANNEGVHYNSFNAMPNLKPVSTSKDEAHQLGLFLTSLGERISQLRKGAGLTQIQLSQLSGLDRAYLSSIENGRQNVTIGAIYKIAMALDTNLVELLVLGEIK